MFRNKSVDVKQFAMVPAPEIPRSSFRMQKTLKTSFDSGFLVPIFCEEVLPGDTWNGRVTMFCRLATPIFPIMDNLHLDTFFFFVPNRLVWQNWVKFMGEQDNPEDSISYSVPVVVSPIGGYPVGSVFDHFGLPTVGQVGGGLTVTHSVLPLRAYNLVFNQWFRDENLVDSAVVQKGDGPDLSSIYELKRRGKRHDYFTSCLPWTQKGGVPATIPIGGQAPVITTVDPVLTGTWPAIQISKIDGSGTGSIFTLGTTAGGQLSSVTGSGVPGGDTFYATNLAADLTAATTITVNQLRQSFQVQKLLERDARGGTRYTELVRSHFGVISPDARLQRPEYIGGGHQSIAVNPVAQTSATAVSGSNTPLGNLAAIGTSVGNNGFTYSSTEHGYIIAVACVTADLTYQQGLRKHWSRSTRYDFYFPAFAMLGEQAVLNKEIYCTGDIPDEDAFGYQERWAEYRYNPSEVHGLFRSTSSGTIDQWHLAQRFTALPTLNDTFISENPPLSRILAVGTEANGQQLLMDAFYDMKVARPLPMYSVPGLIDHF